MKVAIVTDTHFGTRSDSPILLKHQKKFFDETFFPYLKTNKINTIIHLGDTFDRRKIINFATLNESKKFFFDPIREGNFDYYSITGNHDVFYNDTNSINSVSLCLGEYSSLNHYTNLPVHVTLDGLDILLCPWVTRDNKEQSLEIIKKSKAKFLMGHFAIVGFEMDKGTICEHGFDRKIFDHFYQVYSGHFHQPSQADNISYLGAPYEMTWADHALDRGFSVLDTQTLDLTFVKNPNQLTYKIIYDEDDYTLNSIMNIDFSIYKDTYIKLYCKKKKSIELFEKFLDLLNKSDPADVIVIDQVIDTSSVVLNETETTKETLDIVKEYVDEIPQIDQKKKDSLKVFLSSLYKEALELQ